MPDVAETNAAVYICLHRARNAWNKGERAWAKGDMPEVERLTARAIQMKRDADTLDPSHECPAWEDHQRGTH